MKPALTAGFLLLLIALGTADFLLTRDQMTLPTTVAADDDGTPVDEVPADETPAQVGDSGSSSSQGGIVKQSGPDIFAVLDRLGMATEITQEKSLLRQVLPDDERVDMRVLLKNNDRIGFVAWVESPRVKEEFSAFKDALLESFSPEMRDLLDETQSPDGRPVRDVLSFRDPALHEDPLLFVRVRQRLYEFHVVAGREGEVTDLMEELTK